MIRWQSRLDHRTDIWSLGVVLHELVTGQLPFKGSWSAEIFASVLGDLPRPMRLTQPNVPDALEAVVARCLRKDPKERFESAEQLARAIAGVARDARSEPTGSPSAQPERAAIPLDDATTLAEPHNGRYDATRAR